MSTTAILFVIIVVLVVLIAILQWIIGDISKQVEALTKLGLDTLEAMDRMKLIQDNIIAVINSIIKTENSFLNFEDMIEDDLK